MGQGTSGENGQKGQTAPGTLVHCRVITPKILTSARFPETPVPRTARNACADVTRGSSAGYSAAAGTLEGASVNGRGKASRGHPSGMRRVRVADGSPVHWLICHSVQCPSPNFEMPNGPAYRPGEEQGLKGAVSLVLSCLLRFVRWWGGRSLFTSQRERKRRNSIKFLAEEYPQPRLERFQPYADMCGFFLRGSG